MSKQKKAAAKERVKPVTAVSQAASRDEVAVGGGHDSVLTTIEASSTAVAPTRALVPVPSSAKQHPLPLTGFVTHKRVLERYCLYKIAASKTARY